MDFKTTVEDHRNPERYSREQLQAERGALERFLRDLPVESVIERASLESRLKEIEEALKKCKGDVYLIDNGKTLVFPRSMHCGTFPLSSIEKILKWDSELTEILKICGKSVLVWCVYEKLTEMAKSYFGNAELCRLLGLQVDQQKERQWRSMDDPSLPKVGEFIVLLDDYYCGRKFIHIDIAEYDTLSPSNITFRKPGTPIGWFPIPPIPEDIQHLG